MEDLIFNPESLSEMQNEDRTPMFSDEQINNLGKFSGEKGQAKLAKAFIDTESFKGRALIPPKDGSTDEEKAKFEQKLAKVRGVPDNPEGYQIERPAQMPEGMIYDEDMENWFKQQAHANNWTQESVSKVVAEYNKRQFDNNSTYTETVKKAEGEFRTELGEEKALQILGKANDPNNIGSIKRCLLFASAALGLDYKNEQGGPESHLIDCLDLFGKNGCLGDKIPIVKFISWAAERIPEVNEGTTITGAPSTGAAGTKTDLSAIYSKSPELAKK